MSDAGNWGAHDRRAQPDAREAKQTMPRPDHHLRRSQSRYILTVRSLRGGPHGFAYLLRSGPGAMPGLCADSENPGVSATNLTLRIIRM
jgi:hypothetical protein